MSKEAERKYYASNIHKLAGTGYREDLTFFFFNSKRRLRASPCLDAVSKQTYDGSSSACLPAEIGGEDVEQLVPVYQRVEDSAVCTVDHVTLIGGPPAHLPVDTSLFYNQLFKMRQSFL